MGDPHLEQNLSPAFALALHAEQRNSGAGALRTAITGDPHLEQNFSLAFAEDAQEEHL